MKKKLSSSQPAPPPKRPRTTGDGMQAEWEKHTRGIGSKILGKLGFTGRLGKNNDGIAEPILANVRPRLAGVGSSNDNERREAAPDSSEEEDGDDDDDNEEWLATQRERERKREEKYLKLREKEEEKQAEELSRKERVQAEVNEQVFTGSAVIVESMQTLRNKYASEHTKKITRIKNEKLILHSIDTQVEQCKTKIAEIERVKLGPSDTLLGFLDSAQKSMVTDGVERGEEQERMIYQLLKSLANKSGSSSVRSYDNRLKAGLLACLRKLIAKKFKMICCDVIDRGILKKSEEKKLNGIIEVLKFLKDNLTRAEFLEVNLKCIAVPLCSTLSSQNDLRRSGDTREGKQADTILEMKSIGIAEVLERLKPYMLTSSFTVTIEHCTTTIFNGAGNIVHHKSSNERKIVLLGWIDVLGKGDMRQLIKQSRNDLCTRLNRWNYITPNSDTDTLVSNIGHWKELNDFSGNYTVLITVFQQPFRSVCTRVVSACANGDPTWSTVKHAFRAWLQVICTLDITGGSSGKKQEKHSKKVRKLGALVDSLVAKTVLNGPGVLIKNAKTADDSIAVYREVSSWFGVSQQHNLRYRFQNVLAVLLFMIHAKNGRGVGRCSEAASGADWNSVNVPHHLTSNCYSSSCGGR